MRRLDDDERMAGRLDLALKVGGITLTRLLDQAVERGDDEGAAMLRETLAAHTAYYEDEAKQRREEAARETRAVASCHVCDGAGALDASGRGGVSNPLTPAPPASPGKAQS